MLAFAEVGRYSSLCLHLCLGLLTIRNIARWKYFVSTDLTRTFDQIPFLHPSAEGSSLVRPCWRFLFSFKLAKAQLDSMYIHRIISKIRYGDNFQTWQCLVSLYGAYFPFRHTTQSQASHGWQLDTCHSPHDGANISRLPILQIFTEIVIALFSS